MSASGLELNGGKLLGRWPFAVPPNRPPIRLAPGIAQVRDRWTLPTELATGTDALHVMFPESYFPPLQKFFRILVAGSKAPGNQCHIWIEQELNWADENALKR